MSKKKKDKSGKSGKKKPDKKALKKAAKPSAKKNAAKKPSKPVKTKKPVKAVKKSAPKPAKPVKKAVKAKKAIVKKAVKVSKAKPIAKTKPVKKAIVKKAPAPKKTIVKKIAVKPVVKPKVEVKPLKPAISKKQEPVKEIKVSKSVPSAPVSLKKETPVTSEKPKKIEEISAKKLLAEKKSNEVLAITNTIPVKQKNEISLSKIASISHSITNPVKKTDSYAVKPEKEPNGKFEMEFVVHSSAEMLYEFLSTPSGLSEWFCDDLNIRNGIYTFIWDDQLQQARLLKTVELHMVRFQWVDKTDGSYFEFRIQRDDLTNDIALIITDFADTVSERESSKLLWHSQIEKLMHVIGSIF
jgi:uncharacterized protein YndB with AHSA1/START domain